MIVAGNELCDRCHVAIPADAPGGICPVCLFSLAAGLGGRPRKIQDADEGWEMPSQFGDYQLLGEIARGGMGIVYRARQLSLSRTVALKVILAAPFQNPELLRRFQKEAETVARLSHPNIVKIFEAGAQAGLPFFAMEFVPGSNLAALNTPLDPRLAAKYVLQAAWAVEHAHTVGVIHRDIKPSNLLLAADGTVRLTDFGLARWLDSGADLTLTGQSLGSPSFAAPEQLEAAASAPGPAADIYSLGAVLFFLLTGRPPFLSNSPAATIRQVIQDEPVAPRLVNSSIPRNLETICLKCLAKSPGDRYPSARAVAEELERFRAGLAIQARRPTILEKSARWGRRHPLLAAMIAVLVLAVMGWIAAIEHARTHAERAARVSRDAASEKQRLLTRQFIARGFEAAEQQDYSHSLSWFMAAWRNDEPEQHESAHRMRVAAILTRLPHLEALWKFRQEASALDVTREGRLALAASRDRSVLVWDTATRQALASWEERAPVLRARFSPDGSLIACAVTPDFGPANERQAEVIARTLTGERKWTVPLQGTIRSIEFSPDGSHMAATTSSGELAVMATQSGLVVSAGMKHASDARMAQFTPDGEGLVSCSFDSTARYWNWRSGRQLGVFRHDGYVRFLQLSPDGTRLATASDDGVARVWDLRAPGSPPKLFRHRSRVYSVAFSPDGRRMATASSDSTARIWDPATGEPRSSALPHAHRVTRVLFSPDGRQLLTSTSEGLLTLWNPEDGTKRLTFIQSALTTQLVWLPSGDGLLSADMLGLARQWKFPADSPWASELAIPDSPNEMALDHRRNQVLVAMDGGKAILWHWEQTNRVVELAHGQTDVVDAGFVPNRPLCWTVTHDDQLWIWDSESGRELQTVAIPGRYRSVAFSSSGETFAVGCEDGQLQICSLKDGATLSRLKFEGRVEQIRFAHDGQRMAATVFRPNPLQPDASQFSVQIGRPSEQQWRESILLDGLPLDLAFSPDATRLAVSSGAGKAWLLDAELGNVLHTFESPGEIRSVDFGDGGRTLLTAGNQGLVRLWSTSDGRLLTSGLSQGGMARAVFSPDQKWILTWGRDLRAQLWDAETFDGLLPPLLHQDAVLGAGLSADSRYIVTAGLDRKLRAWAIPRPSLELAEANRLARLLTGQTVDETASIVALSADELDRLWKQPMPPQSGE